MFAPFIDNLNGLQLLWVGAESRHPVRPALAVSRPPSHKAIAPNVQLNISIAQSCHSASGHKQNAAVP
jgi:hypothetical protein